MMQGIMLCILDTQSANSTTKLKKSLKEFNKNRDWEGKRGEIL
jgi:hypothetical protein